MTAEKREESLQKVPFSIIAREDEPSVRLVGYLSGSVDLAEGQAMSVWFEELDEGVVLPQWEPATERETP